MLGSVDQEDVRLHQPCCHNASAYGLRGYIDNTLPSRCYASPLSCVCVGFFFEITAFPNMKLSETQCPTTSEDREKMKVIPYASTIGSIMYVMLCTRPDVCLAISLEGRYQSNPGVDHWTVVKNILKYLKRTKDMFLVYASAKSSS